MICSLSNSGRSSVTTILRNVRKNLKYSFFDRQLSVLCIKSKANQRKLCNHIRRFEYLSLNNLASMKLHSSANRKSAKNSDEWESLRDNDEKRENIASIPTKKENIFTVPNLLSFCRIIAAPFIGGLVLDGQYTVASSLLLVAAVTDVLDGQIARRWPSQKSAFGTALDPLGDKILVTVLTLSLTIAEMLPFPLAVLIIGRDVALIASVFYLRYRTCPPPLTLKRFFDPTLVNAQLNPTLISKVNTVLQVCTLWASLTAPIFNFSHNIGLHSLYVLTGVTTVWSGLSYVFDKTTVQILKDK